MDHSTNSLLATAVLCLIAAFAGGLVARLVKLPVLLGYLFAGIVIGPFTPGLTADQDITANLADIGVTLLLFNVGLHFSLKDLMSVRRIAGVGALLQIGTTLLLGTAFAKIFLNVAWAEAIMVGLGVSIASTAISTRLLIENRQMARFAGRAALGWLVVQDLAVIFAMVLFPIFIGEGSHDLATFVKDISDAVIRLLGFAVAIFLGARYCVPRLLGYVARTGSHELFTLGLIVTALGVAYGSAVVFGVSLALGAFFAGVVIGESDLNHHAAAEILSLQEIFTIFFFVSAGMLFNPATLVQKPIEIAVLWSVIVFGMGGITMMALIAARLPVLAAATVGGAFSQIGEFTFVLAQMGHHAGILNEGTRDLLLATAIVSILLSPLSLAAFRRLGLFIADTKWVQQFQADGAAPVLTPPLDGHVILVGFGRVGKIVAAALQAHKIVPLVIEADRKRMEAARRQDMPTLYGDCTRETIFAAAQPEAASLLIVTVPESHQARRIVSLARKTNPDLRVIVRVHEENDARYMEKQGASLVVMGEREIGIGLSSYALGHFHVDPQVIHGTLDRLRHQDGV